MEESDRVADKDSSEQHWWGRWYT